MPTATTAPDVESWMRRASRIYRHVDGRLTVERPEEKRAQTKTEAEMKKAPACY